MIAEGVFAPGHLGGLTQIVPFEMVDAVLADSGGTQHRLRKLPARVVVYVLLGAALFEQIGYPAVWRKLTGPLEGLPVPKITATALWHARTRLGSRPLRALFDLLRGAAAAPGTAGTRWAGMLVCAIDGTCLDAVAGTSADFLARLSAARRPPVLHRYRDDSFLSQIGQVKVRIIEITITIATAAGRRTGIYRLATTLLNPDRHPAFELVSSTTNAGRSSSPTSRSKRRCWAAASCAPAPQPASSSKYTRSWPSIRIIRIAIADATGSTPGTDPDRASFTVALEAARDQVIQAANIIATTVIDLVGTIGRRVLDNLMPDRRLRLSPRTVKRPMSRYACKSLKIDRRSYKATLAVGILTPPISP